MNLPRGFRYAGVACGIKKSGNLDYSLIYSETPAVAAGVYTQNIVYAAPVAYDRQRTPAEQIRAIATNSGNANACTGEQGQRDAEQMATQAASACGVTQDQVLVMSTGIIGEFLPMKCLARGASDAGKQLAKGEEAFHRAAEAILTTDNGEKSTSRELKIGSRSLGLAGMAKGAGMIGPNMATMLGAIVTDASLTPHSAQAVLKRAVDQSFNNICVEGHTSTNDTVSPLANGMAGDRPLAADELERFANALTELCIELATMIPADGEGASHLISIEVCGTSNDEDSRLIARTIAESALVKTGIAGHDPNWGRIISAAGYAGVDFDPARMNLILNGFLLYENGRPQPFEEAEVSASLRDNHETTIELDLQSGEGRARFWTSDLTVDYVRFNSEYHT